MGVALCAFERVCELLPVLFIIYSSHIIMGNAKQKKIVCCMSIYLILMC